MARTAISTVERIDNEVIVTYVTGTEKRYPADKLPKTVQAWIEAHKTEEPAEGADTTEQGAVEAVVEGTKGTVEGAVEEETAQEPEEAEQGEEMNRNEIITQEPESLLAFADSMGAAEGVGFILMMGAATMWLVLAGLAGLAVEAIKTAAFLLWSHREEIRQAGAEQIERAAEWIKAATEEAKETVETVRAWTEEARQEVSETVRKARKAGRSAADRIIIFVGDRLVNIPMTSTTAAARMAARMTVLCIGILAILS